MACLENCGSFSIQATEAYSELQRIYAWPS